MTYKTKLSFKDISRSLKKQRILLKLKTAKGFDESKSYTIAVDESSTSSESCFILYDGVNLKAKDKLSKKLLTTIKLIIIEKEELIDLLPTSISYLLVSSGRRAWSYLAAEAYSNPQEQLKIIGITGTNGKTTTAWILTDLLKQMGKKSAYIGTLGSSLLKTKEKKHTTPDPCELFALLKKAKDENYEYIALEVSSHALSQEKISPIGFSSAIFTSFSRDHLDFHKSMKEYFQTKLSLFENYLRPSAPVFFHQSLASRLTEGFLEKTKPSFYCEFKAEYQQQRTLSTLHLYNQKSKGLDTSFIHFNLGGKNYKTEIPFLGQHNCDNFFVSVLVAQALTQQIKENTWPLLHQVPGRLERILPGAKKEPYLFVDYAHTPDALERALVFLKSKQSTGKLFVLFGCGGDRDQGKRPLMGAVAEKTADKVIITTDNPRNEEPAQIIADIQKGFSNKKKFLVIENRKEAIYKALKMINKQDCLLLAGKGHEPYQEIKGKKYLFSEQKILSEYFRKKVRKNESNHLERLRNSVS